MSAINHERLLRQAKRELSQASLASNCRLVGVVSREQLDTCFAILQTPAATGSMRTIMEGMVGGHPGVTWQMKAGYKLKPWFEDVISAHGIRLAKKIYEWKLAAGFVPLKTYRDEVTGIKFGFIPDQLEFDVHVIQNTESRRLKLALWFHNRDHHANEMFSAGLSSAQGAYDPEVNFVVHSMPRLDGRLTSQMMSLVNDFNVHKLQQMASIALDWRAVRGEVMLRPRLEDDKHVQEDTSASANLVLSQYFKETQSLSRDARGGGGGSSMVGIRQLGALRSRASRASGKGSRMCTLIPKIRSEDIHNAAGVRTYTELPVDADVVPMPVQRSATNMAVMSQEFARKVAIVIGVPPSMLSSNAVSHGKGLEEIHSELNTIVTRQAIFIRSALQRAVDISYGKARDEEIKRHVLSSQQQSFLREKLTDMLRLQQRHAKQTGTSKPLVLPITQEEVQQQMMVTDSKYTELSETNRIVVVLAVDVRISVERIRELHEELGMVTRESAQDMIRRTLNLTRDQMSAVQIASSIIIPTAEAAATTTAAQKRKRDSSGDSKGSSDSGGKGGGGNPSTKRQRKQ